MDAYQQVLTDAMAAIARRPSLAATTSKRLAHL
jgi:hypothetical protein